MIGLDLALPPDHVGADPGWYRNRIWKGAIA
jgi:hypothetical protein